ncbi:sulfatase [Halopiger thermotolerans]
MADKPNILFIVWDTVRSQNTSLNGYHRTTTPELTKIAKEAVQFTEARASAPWTLPSHASIFTGLYPREHGTTSQNLKFSLSDRHLASQLSTAGYETGLFTSNTYLSTPTFGLTQGFDFVFSNKEDVLFSDGMNPDAFTKIHGTGSYIEFIRSSLTHESTLKSILNGITQKTKDFGLQNMTSSHTEDSTEYIDALFDWIEATEDPFFGFLNLMDAHAPYCPPRNFNNYSGESHKDIPQTPPWLYLSGNKPKENLSKIEDIYDDCITFLDSMLSEIYRRLDGNGYLEDTIIIITSDHGEAFGEVAETGRNRILYGHTQGVDEVLLHVPLVIRFPDKRYAGKVVDDLVSLKDLYYTIRNEVGLGNANDKTRLLYPDTPKPEWVIGEWYGFTDNARQSAEEHGVDLDQYDQELVAYYENSDSDLLKYSRSNNGWDHAWSLRNGSIVDDISDTEINALRSRASRRIDSLNNAASEGQTVDISEETIDDLESLGYI